MTAASVVIANFNYAPYLREAIDSALAQTHVPVEVVVVDDGSTDGSPEIIRGYGDRVVGLLRAREGNNAAINAALPLTRGEVVVLLDADDTLEPTALARAVAALRDPAVVKAHWPLREMEGDGRPTGCLRPRDPLPEGDLRDALLRFGPDGCAYPPTSGNAWRRSFLEEMLPLPTRGIEDRPTSGAPDALLSMHAPLYGRIACIPEPQGSYRLHGANNHGSTRFDDRLRRDLRRRTRFQELLAERCRSLGLEPDVEAWNRHSWIHRIARAEETIARTVPPGERFLLVDESYFGFDTTDTRRPVAFPELDGAWAGRPADSDAAIAELERRRAEGVRFLVVGWPAFWWLDHYDGFARHVRASAREVLADDSLAIYDLRAA